jgi:DNA-binding response OmpR family regulator
MNIYAIISRDHGDQYKMQIIIFASTPDIAQKMQTDLGDTTNRFTVAATWADVLSFLDTAPPDLVLVERTALSQIDLATLHKLTQTDRWPPLLLVGTRAVDALSGIAATQRLAQEAQHYTQIGELRIDTRRKRATIGERWVALPPIQYRLLLVLARRAGETIGCQELLRTVWGYDAGEIEARELVKVHIRQIRRRLGLDPEKHQYIHSVRGFGYVLAPPGDE